MPPAPAPNGALPAFEAVYHLCQGFKVALERGYPLLRRGELALQLLGLVAPALQLVVVVGLCKKVSHGLSSGCSEWNGFVACGLLAYARVVHGLNDAVCLVGLVNEG